MRCKTDKKQNLVGRSIKRLDAKAKADGSLRYTDDLEFIGLYGAVIRSSVAYGKILSITYSKEFDFSDFTIVDYKDIEGVNKNIILTDDQPFLSEGVVRFIGEPILLIAYKSKKALRDAKKYIHIEYEEFESVLTLEDAKKRENLIYKTINTQKGVKPDCSKLHTITKTYTTPHQEQLYLEPQSMLARYSEDGIKIVGSMQCPFYVESALIHLTNEKIEVEQAPTGGGFGGKEDYPSIMAAYVYLLSKKSKQDVKLVYERDEDIAYTTKRHPTQMEYKSCFDDSGKLHSLEIDISLDGGAYCTLTPVVQSRCVLHCAGFYDCTYIKVTSNSYATNTPPNGAFRGFGAPQAIFGIERHIDDIAKFLGISPMDAREVNLPTSVSKSVTDAKIDEHKRVRDIFQRAREVSRFDEKYKSKKPYKGVGMALFMHGGGFTGIGESLLNSVVWLDLSSDGMVEIKISSVEMGQGAMTVLPQIVADELGIPLELVRYHTPNTKKVANSGPTVASRTVMIVGELLTQASQKLRVALGEYADVDSYKQKVKEYLNSNTQNRFDSKYEKPSNIKWDEDKFYGNGYDGYSLGCYVAEVEVDPITYAVSVNAFYAINDAGKVINPILAQGQIEGGVAQGIGYALYENIIHQDGKVKNSRLSDYIVPYASDVPKMVVEFLDTDAKAKGLGELPMDGPAPAIVNAILNATGVEFDAIPITPEVLESRWR